MIDKIKQLQASGLSFTKIAGVLNMTRGQVAGIVYRAMVGNTVIKVKTTEVKLIKSRAKRIENKRNYEKGLIYLIDIKESQCREIIGEPLKGMCCGRRVFKGSYCREHYENNYQKEHPRGYDSLAKAMAKRESRGISSRTDYTN